MDTIRRLTGPERVRLRPAVIFGSDGAEGALFAVELTADIFLTEARMGFCDGFEIILHADGSVSMYSADRGLRLSDTAEGVLPDWKEIFCGLYPGPREPGANYFYELGEIHNHLYGETEGSPLRIRFDHCMELCCVQSASEWMRVEAVRGGEKKILEFRRGCSTGPLRAEPTGERNGTFLHFRLDPAVFTDIRIPFAALDAYLRQSGAACRLYDEKTGSCKNYEKQDL